MWGDFQYVPAKASSVLPVPNPFPIPRTHDRLSGASSARVGKPSSIFFFASPGQHFKLLRYNVSAGAGVGRSNFLCRSSQSRIFAGGEDDGDGDHQDGFISECNRCASL